ncbi:aminotransferase class III-fold pyridoxal phosphate-dependent enzyme [Aggregatimonas sangjinii]|uniref:Aminotransferase class III-fold pyridoxal phosphate-dependent enzyme n=1 Tax=Aggregatimonas sangjinii TaxID=2583587 RepID=A0A5B7SN83_9FLAO|nr:aminotransferase class III-fold pyridoxal phosphate-dependent enzyme [Aggregatimonas sangjinii]QCX00016.1 aminotransferase class III-fold pyridoxal phosphate-dependent enzyme [Aggregatimonas sangjinii]
MDPNDILQSHFGFANAKVTPLEGYDSINFKIVSDKGTYVLKQYQLGKQIGELLAAEDAILNSLSTIKNLDFPVPIKSISGDSTVVENGFLFRLLSYVDGEFLGNVTHTPALLRSLGTFMAQLDKNLYDSYHAPISAKEIQWDLRYFKRNHKYLKYIPNAKDRSLVDYFFVQFDEHIYPIQDQFRRGIIHNDGNHWNVLTKNGEVSGIIDFGDMCHSWLVNEVTIAITYVMMGKSDPLAIAAHVIEGYHSVFPLTEKEINAIYYLVGARLCTSVCNSAYSKTLKPDSEYITISEKLAWELLRKWLTINPIKAANRFRRAAGFSIESPIFLKDQLKRRDQFFSKAFSLSYKEPIQMHRSAFQYMYDAGGNTFLDAYNNIMLAGHSHPTVVRAAQKNMARLNTNTRYVYEELLSYGEKLLERFPPALNKVFFVNSGSAASDLAIRLAMTHTNREKVMVLEHGYHGNTRIGIDISHYKYEHSGGSGKQDYIIEIPMPNAFGSGFKDNGAAGAHYAGLTAKKLRENENRIAAFIAEPIVGCGGQVPLAKGYLKEVYPQIRAQGGICISDEVQVGFGRLGDYFWGFEMHEVVPDVVILGKPMANGHPIGAVVTTSEIAESFANGLEFFSSFGGNPVSCAIGNAVLKVIENEKLQQHAKVTGDYLKELLRDLQQKCPQLADVRGHGLFIGVEIFDDAGKPNTELASHIKNELRQKHILIGTDGPYDSVLKIKPPLSFTAADCEILVGAIESVLHDSHKN